MIPQEKKYQPLEKSIPYYLIYIALVLFLTSAILNTVDWESFPNAKWFIGLFHHILDEAGIALIIAFCISQGIEKRAREHHNEMVQRQIDIIKDNYFEATFNHTYEPKFLLAAKNIFSQPFFRKGYEITIVLSVPDHNPPQHCCNPESVLQVDIVSTFKMQNLSNEERIYSWIYFIEKSDIKNYHDRFILRSLTIDKKQLSEQEIQEADILLEDTNLFKKYKKDIPIPANSEIFIEASSTIFKYSRDHLFWQTISPSDGMRMTVTYPLELYMAGNAIGVISDTENQLKTCGNGPKSSSLIINEPLFPHNGIYIWWHPCLAEK